MKVLAAILIFCSGCTAFQPCDHPDPFEVMVPGSWVSTPKGTPVRVPLWLSKKTDWLQATLEEIDAVTPKVDERLPPLPEGLEGVPAGISVVVRDPGYYSFAGSLATGHTDMRSYIHVAYASPPQHAIGNGAIKHLPALQHEVAHVIYEQIHGVGRGANH